MIKYRMREYAVILEENCGYRFFCSVSAKTAKQAICEAYMLIMNDDQYRHPSYSIRPISAKWLDRPERKPKHSKTN